MSTPIAKILPQVKLIFNLGNLVNTDWGRFFQRVEYRGLINGGYILRAKLFDANYHMLQELIKNGYLQHGRRKPIEITFQILAGPGGIYPETATKPQKAILVALNTVGGKSDMAELEFIAIDPPSWYLNVGDASGKVWKGRVDQVIRQTVQTYAPGVDLTISKTVDSSHNKWWMMRQDPRTFILSLLEWSSALTNSKTQWIVEMNNYAMLIRDQASIPSRQRGYYRYFNQKEGKGNIVKISIVADNVLSALQTRLLSTGLSSITGHYYDNITDIRESQTVVKDSTTTNKQVPRVNEEQSFSKPLSDSFWKSELAAVGWTHIPTVPEIYNGGELGIDYGEYLDGRARNIWLNMTRSVIHAKLTTIGHGEWSDTMGLGTDTVFINWRAAPIGNFWWTTGNWLAYGFHHTVTKADWYTDLYISRYDHDSIAKKVP